MSTSSFVVVQQFYDHHELVFAERHLRQQGIPTQTRDVRSLQTFTTLEARAIGGARLLVPAADYHRATQLLIEGGYRQPSSSAPSFRWVQALDEWASCLPMAQQLPRELRLVALGFVLLSLVFSLLLAFLLLK